MPEDIFRRQASHRLVERRQRLTQHEGAICVRPAFVSQGVDDSIRSDHVFRSQADRDYSVSAPLG